MYPEDEFEGLETLNAQDAAMYGSLEMPKNRKTAEAKAEQPTYEGPEMPKDGKTAEVKAEQPAAPTIWDEAYDALVAEASEDIEGDRVLPSRLEDSLKKTPNGRYVLDATTQDEHAKRYALAVLGPFMSPPLVDRSSITDRLNGNPRYDAFTEAVRDVAFRVYDR